MTIEVTARGIIIPTDELFWRFSRSSGPGGQSVNTTDSRAELSFNVAQSAVLPPALKERALRALAGQLTDGVITVTAAENRSQLRNREAAAARLSALLAAATAPPPRPRRPTRPTKGSRERRLAAKQQRSQTKRLRRPPTD
jgi:ribosome-associated protein